MDSCSFSNLPREFIERIFTRCNINPKDLASCSLVCTTWRFVIADIWGKNLALLTSSPVAIKFIVKEYKRIQMENLKFFKVRFAEDLSHWEAIMIGPQDTPYADGVFLLNIHISDRHPFQSPIVNFKTKVYHPNIGEDGKLCLEESWSVAVSIFNLLLVIYARFSTPELDDPLDIEIAHIYQTQRNLFEEQARSWTREYATASQESAINWSQFLEDQNIL